MTYNILLGGAGCRVEAIARVVEAVRPDILAIQEANDEAVLYQLAERWGMAVHYGHATSAFRPALLSPHRLTPEPVEPRPGHLAKTLVRARIDLPGGPIVACATHLSARPWHWGRTPAFRRREAAEVLRLTEGADLLMADCNALSPGDRLRPSDPPRPLDVALPRYPMWINRTVLAALPYRPCRLAMRWLIEREMPREIVGRLLAGGWVDAYRRAEPSRPGYTWPAPWPLARIDLVLARPPLAALVRRAVRVQTPTAWQASDHLPVVVDFSGVPGALAPGTASPEGPGRGGCGRGRG